MHLSETRRRAELAWSQMTRRPLIVEHRHLRRRNEVSVYRQGRVKRENPAYIPLLSELMHPKPRRLPHE